MTRDEFCKHHWSYYLVLEKDFLEIERYIELDLGDNYLYNCAPTDLGNSETFSNEFVKQLQTICSEVEVVLKTICVEISGYTGIEKMPQYTSVVLQSWPDIKNQKVRMRENDLIPFQNWQAAPNYSSPDWWPLYNGVKHNRIINSRKANLKNTINALAALFILEQFLVRFIGQRDQEKDVPNDVSNLFEMVDYHTEDTVIGRDTYLMNHRDIESIIN